MNTKSLERSPIRLTSLPGAIRDKGFVPLDYRLLRDAAIPAHQRRGIWHFYLEDTTAIAKALRLDRTSTVAA